MVLPHVFVIFIGAKRPFDPGRVNYVYELGRVWRLIEKPHGTGLITETIPPLVVKPLKCLGTTMLKLLYCLLVCWEKWMIELGFSLVGNQNGCIRHQRPKDIMISGSFGMKLMILERMNLLIYNTILEDNEEPNSESRSKLWLVTKAVKNMRVKRTKPGIIEDDVKIGEFQSFFEINRSEIQGKKLFMTYALSLLDAWRSFMLKTTQGEGSVVYYGDLAFIQALLGSKWEQVILVASEIQLTTPTYAELGISNVVWVVMTISLGAERKVCAPIGFFFHFLPP